MPDQIDDALHTLACCHEDMIAERAEINHLSALLGASQTRWARALRGVLECGTKLERLGMDPDEIPDIPSKALE